MNVANLQLEGLLMAIAWINNVLVRKGMLSVQEIDEALAVAADIGYPILIKPSAGGGGKGMKEVTAPAELEAAIATARRVAASAFGDDTLFLERLVKNPRHIEVQVLADNHGNVIHLLERECSLQRRHQKVIEEAPSPLLDARTRARIGEAACEAARSVDYSGAGTVEFLVSADAPDDFFFMEMNTRLQVEHPVTELVTGIDLVEWQVRIAAGEVLGIAQDDVRANGHAMEARVYAENPQRGFLPATGKILALREAAGTGMSVTVTRIDPSAPFAHESRSATVRLKTSRSGPASGSTAPFGRVSRSPGTTTRCWPRWSRGGARAKSH